MTSDGKCERRRLAQRGSFNVEACDCGAVHHTIGFLTVRLDSCAYRELADALHDGLRAMEPRDQTTIH
jgi:hypothetical protein